MNHLSHLHLVPDTGLGPMTTPETIQPDESNQDHHLQRAIRLLSLALAGKYTSKDIRALVVEAVSVLNVNVIPALNTIIKAENFAANNVAKVKEADIVLISSNSSVTGVTHAK